jgi:hypothetical protein
MREPSYLKTVWIALVLAATMGAAIVAYAILHGPLPN